VQNNRMFYWAINPNADQTNCLLNTTAQTCYGLLPNVAAGDAPVFSDLGVIGGASLTASYSMLTANSVTPVMDGGSNTLDDPLFAARTTTATRLGDQDDRGHGDPHRGRLRRGWQLH